VDVSVEDPAQSREALQSSLEKVNDELLNLKAKWANEKQALAGEKAVLRDTANRLNAEIKAESAKVELERKKAFEMARRLQDDAERQKALLQLVCSHYLHVRHHTELGPNLRNWIGPERPSRV
jgi:DNA-directed RNA polymerase sigma subunit (sigma70/sigma32)